MMKNIFLTLLLSTLALTGCHTFAWQDVEGGINGTWTQLPAQPGNIIQYTFDNGTLSITVNGLPVNFTDEDKNQYPSLEYRVDKKADNHYVIIQKLRNPSSIGRTEMFYGTTRWLVVKQTGSELFIISEGDNGLKGEYQLEFFKLD